MTKKVKKPSERALIALEFLQSQEEYLTGDMIAEAIGVNSTGIHGVLQSLVQRDYVKKGDKVKVMTLNNKGLKQEKEYVTYLVTDLGFEYEIED